MSNNEQRDMGNEYLHHRPPDLWWRRYGMWLYMACCAVVIHLIPAGASAPDSLRWALAALPALRDLMENSQSEGRIVGWVLSSIAFYPVMHRALYGRIRRTPPRSDHWKGLLSIFVIDIVLAGVLFINVVSLQGNRIARFLQTAMTTDGVMMIVVAVMISAVYAFLVFANFHILKVVLLNSSEER